MKTIKILIERSKEFEQCLSLLKCSIFELFRILFKNKYVETTNWEEKITNCKIPVVYKRKLLTEKTILYLTYIESRRHLPDIHHVYILSKQQYRLFNEMFPRSICDPKDFEKASKDWKIDRVYLEDNSFIKS